MAHQVCVSDTHGLAPHKFTGMLPVVVGVRAQKAAKLDCSGVYDVKRWSWWAHSSRCCSRWGTKQLLLTKVEWGVFDYNVIIREAHMVDLLKCSLDGRMPLSFRTNLKVSCCQLLVRVITFLLTWMLELTNSSSTFLPYAIQYTSNLNKSLEWLVWSHRMAACMGKSWKMHNHLFTSFP